jgi:hypothetical protein
MCSLPSWAHSAAEEASSAEEESDDDDDGGGANIIALHTGRLGTL